MINANTTEANPRGPNQPTNATVSQSMRDPRRLTANAMPPTKPLRPRSTRKSDMRIRLASANSTLAIVWTASTAPPHPFLVKG